MTFSETRATAAIAVATIIVSTLITVLGFEQDAMIIGGFIPALASGASLPPDLGFVLPFWLTPLSATLIHAGFVHLAMNMVMLVYCGQQAERSLGVAPIAILYVAGAYAAAFGQWVQDPASPIPMVGASGAISALVAAYALLYGRNRARAIGPIPASVVHVIWLAAAWIGIQLLFGVAGLAGMTRIAIGAHIGGFIAGLALARPLLLWRYRHA